MCFVESAKEFSRIRGKGKGFMVKATYLKPKPEFGVLFENSFVLKRELYATLPLREAVKNQNSYHDWDSGVCLS